MLLKNITLFFKYPIIVHSSDDGVNVVIDFLLKHDWSDILKKHDHYFLVFVIGNLEIRVWNANRYYGWLSEGVVVRGDNIIYTWNDKMPSRYYLNLFRKKYREYIKKMKNKEINSLRSALTLYAGGR